MKTVAAVEIESYLLAASNFLSSSSSSGETSFGRELLFRLVDGVDSQLSLLTALLSGVTGSAAVTSAMMASLLMVLSPLLLLLSVDEHDSDDNLRLTMSLSVLLKKKQTTNSQRLFLNSAPLRK